MLVDEYVIPGARVRDREVEVPLDWFGDDEGSITVFCRELSSTEPGGEQRPLLLFLQGGPGGRSPRPLDADDGWLRYALARFRVVLLDQRGTGRSSRVDAAALGVLGSPEQARDYLLHFRADSIVADCEHLREHVFHVPRWATLGQSYGGFLTLTYLSAAPESLSACYVAGGLAGLTASAEDVYARTFPRMAAKTRDYYRRYPGDERRWGEIADRVADGGVLLPDGDQLTVRRLQLLGQGLGMMRAPERLHWLAEDAWSGPVRARRLSDSFLAEVCRQTSYDDRPLYWLLQESIYGLGRHATAWAAQREIDRRPAFAESARPLLFTGEAAFPWMFSEIRSLRPFEQAAHALAEWDDYSSPYDPARLAGNQVPVEAALYFEDMYVDAELSLRTAASVGNLHAWVTNEFQHDGLRVGDVARRLFEGLDKRGGPRAVR